MTLSSSRPVHIDATASSLSITSSNTLISHHRWAVLFGVFMSPKSFYLHTNLSALSEERSQSYGTCWRQHVIHSQQLVSASSITSHFLKGDFITTLQAVRFGNVVVNFFLPSGIGKLRFASLNNYMSSATY